MASSTKLAESLAYVKPKRPRKKMKPAGRKYAGFGSISQCG